ncbi:MAG TPA: hypothetical protein VJQ79_15495, partial [Acidimicrobiia bacterium]|nr:hypothetical protein [Acidimicrobiia bacterium]
RLAYSGVDPNIYLLPVEGNGEGLTLAGTRANVFSLTFVGSRHLLSFGEDALMWDVSPEGPSQLDGVRLSERHYGFQISPDARLLSYFTLSDGGSEPWNGLRLVDLQNEQEVLAVAGEVMTDLVGYRQASPDLTMVGSLTHDGVSTVRRLPSWDVVRRFDDCRAPLAISPDNRRVLLTGWVCAAEAPPDVFVDSEVIDLDTGETILALPYRAIWSAAFNPAGLFETGSYLITSDQSTVEVWDMVTQQSIGRFGASDLGDVGLVLGVAFDPTGRFVIGGSTGGTVWALNMEQVVGGADLLDALVFKEQAHTGAVPVPALSADGVVATAGFDGVARLWDLDSGNLLLEFEPDLGTPLVRFSPDGSHLLYPHGLSIRRLPVDPHELRALAAKLLTRDFLPDECARYAQKARCDLLAG